MQDDIRTLVHWSMPECFVRRLLLLRTLLSFRGVSPGQLIWRTIVQAIPAKHFKSLYGHDIPPDYGWDILAEANRRLLPQKLRQEGYSFVFLNHRPYDRRAEKQFGLDYFSGGTVFPLSDTTHAHMLCVALGHTPLDQFHWVSLRCRPQDFHCFVFVFSLGVAGPRDTFPFLIRFEIEKRAIFSYTWVCKRPHCGIEHCGHAHEASCANHSYGECRDQYESCGVSSSVAHKRRVLFGTFQEINDGPTDRLITHLLKSDFAFIQRFCYAHARFGPHPRIQPWKSQTQPVVLTPDEYFQCVCAGLHQKPERWGWPINKPKYCFQDYDDILGRIMRQQPGSNSSNCILL